MVSIIQWLSALDLGMGNPGTQGPHNDQRKQGLWMDYFVINKVVITLCLDKTFI